MIQTETVQPNNCSSVCSGGQYRCLTLYEVCDTLNSDPDFVEKFRGSISYATLVSWVREREKEEESPGSGNPQKLAIFPNAHKVGKQWAIPVADLEGVADRVPPRGNPDWARGVPTIVPRRERDSYRWGYIFEDRARKLIEQYPPAGVAVPNKYALETIKHAKAAGQLDDLDMTPGKYPAKELKRQIVKLVRQSLQSA